MAASFIFILGLTLFINIQYEPVTGADSNSSVHNEITEKQCCLRKLTNQLEADINNGADDCKQFNNNLNSLEKLVKDGGDKCWEETKQWIPTRKIFLISDLETQVLNGKLKYCLEKLEKDYLKQNLEILLQWRLCVVKKNPLCEKHPSENDQQTATDQNKETPENNISTDSNLEITDSYLDASTIRTIIVDTETETETTDDTTDDEDSSDDDGDDGDDDNSDDITIIGVTEEPDGEDIVTEETENDKKDKSPKDSDELIDTETCDHYVDKKLVGQTIKEFHKGLNNEDMLLNQTNYNIDKDGKKTELSKNKNNWFQDLITFHWWGASNQPNWSTSDGKPLKLSAKKCVRDHKVNRNLIGQTEEFIEVDESGKDIVKEHKDYNIDIHGKKTVVTKNGKKHWEKRNKHHTTETVEILTEEHYVNGKLVGVTQKKVQKGGKNKKKVIGKIHFNVDDNGNKVRLHKKDKKNWVDTDGTDVSSDQVITTYHKVKGKTVGRTVTKINRKTKKVVEIKHYNIDENSNETEVPKYGKKNWVKPKKKPDTSYNVDDSWNSSEKTRTFANGTKILTITRNYKRNGKPIGRSIEEYVIEPDNSRKLVKIQNINIDDNGKETEIQPGEKKNWEKKIHKKTVYHKKNGVVVGKTVTITTKDADGSEQKDVKDYNIDENNKEEEVKPGGRKNWITSPNTNDSSHNNQSSLDSSEKTIDINGKKILTITRNYKRNGKLIGKSIQQYEVAPDNTRKLIKSQDINIDDDGKETEVKPGQKKNWETSIRKKTIYHKRNGIIIGKTIIIITKNSDGTEQNDIKYYNVDKNGKEEEVKPGALKNWSKNPTKPTKPSGSSSNYEYSWSNSEKSKTFANGTKTRTKTHNYYHYGKPIGKCIEIYETEPNGTEKLIKAQDINIDDNGKETELKPGEKRNWELSVHKKIVNHKVRGVVVGKTVTVTSKLIDGTEKNDVKDYNINSDGKEEEIKSGDKKNWNLSENTNDKEENDQSTSTKTISHKRNHVLVGKTVITSTKDGNGKEISKVVKDYNVDKNGKEEEIPPGGNKNWVNTSDDKKKSSTHQTTIYHKINGVLVGKTVKTITKDTEGKDVQTEKDYNIYKDGKIEEVKPDSQKNWEPSKSTNNNAEINSKSSNSYLQTVNHKKNGILVGKTVTSITKEADGNQQTIVKDYNIDSNGKEEEVKQGGQKNWETSTKNLPI